MKLKLVLNGYRLPSLNQLFKMSHWARGKARRRAHLALLSALHLSALDSATLTISARKRLWTACATLRSYLTTDRKTSISSSVRKSAPHRKSALK